MVTEPARSARRSEQRAGGLKRRRGYVYLAVLFTSLIVAASVAAALTASTANLSARNGRTGRMSALRLAESELHRVAAVMQDDIAWRDAFENDVFTDWYAPSVDGVPLAAAEVRVRFSDDDGDLADDHFDPVAVTVQANVEHSTATLIATLEPDPVAWDLLRYAVTATDDLQLNNGSVLTTESPVQVSDDCQSNSYGILVTPRLECDRQMEFTLRGDQAVDSLVLPSRSLMDDYIDQGTQIDLNALPVFDSRRAIRDVVLSASNNPFGATDPAGIYWIDAGGSSLRISNCRIEATLAIRDANTIEIRDAVQWQYPTGPDAILVTDGKIEMTELVAELSENDRGVNFNPFRSPYRGVADVDTDDSYPCEFRGVISTPDRFEIDATGLNGYLRFTGSVLCHDLRIEAGSVQIHSLSELISDPPRGLADPTPMRFVRGTLRRIATP